MVSNTIFGKTGAPCREVYSWKNARPGDIVVKTKTSTGTAAHVSVITNVEYVNGKWMASVCGGNVSSKVSWNWDAEMGYGAYGMQNFDSSYTYRIFTRYPQ